MKNIILVLFVLVTNNINQIKVNNTFVNYNSSTPGITDNDVSGVAFDSNGNVGIATLGGGLCIGIQHGPSFKPSYTFTNYNSSNTPGIADNEGLAVAFDPSTGDVAYGSDGGGLSIGIKNSSGYTFKHYNQLVPGISNASIHAVAFDSNGNIGLATDGGLSIGVKDGSNYNFTLYDTNNTLGITSDFGRGIAFDKNNNVGYASYENGSHDGALSIGVKNGSSYKFTNYSKENTAGITNNDGLAVAFNPNTGSVAYGSNGGGLSYGTKNGSSYRFNNYSKENTKNVTNDTVTEIAFNDIGVIGWSSAGTRTVIGGLSVAYKLSADLIVNYNSTNTPGITSEAGLGVAFDHSGNVAYGSIWISGPIGGGLSIGRTFSSF